ncbi:ABC transporter substrate-binding protein [Pseudomonas sp. S25]|uniref:ABC transporter substrate-binding protein n=1 Tax=Pseudomonas maioricensis TaxID=1766623 RepID=A0ABS9ZV66_9PSED|nr:ABC transporter substrate-binding protein [Pseudomonas sp. S25]
MDTAVAFSGRTLRCIVVAALMWAHCTAASAADILLTAARTSPSIQSFVRDLSHRRPGDHVRFVETDKMPSPGKISDHTRLVLLDTASLEWRLGDSEGPRTLVLRVSRVQAHERLGEKRPPTLSLLWSDPPVTRQLLLIRHLLPEARQIGVLFNNRSQFLLKELRHAALSMGLRIISQPWTPSAQNQSLQNLLSRSDVLLGLDDPDLYNAKTAKNLLLSSYAHQQALLGPNAAFVKAGSLASTYSDEIDWLDTLDALLDKPPEQWPRAQYPRRFKVTSNPRVAQSLGIIAIDDAAVTTRLSQAEQQP